jgi:hypothetical protein
MESKSPLKIEEKEGHMGVKAYLMELSWERYSG